MIDIIRIFFIVLKNRICNMYKYHCLNPISSVGLDQLNDKYAAVNEVNDADAILVRSTKMHEMEFSKELKAIARAGAGVNNIPLDRCAVVPHLRQCGFVFLPPCRILQQDAKCRKCTCE